MPPSRYIMLRESEREKALAALRGSGCRVDEPAAAEKPEEKPGDCTPS